MPFVLTERGGRRCIDRVCSEAQENIHIAGMQSRPSAAFVHRAVAIVIFAVAEFCAGCIGRFAEQYPFETTQDALLAGALGFGDDARLVEIGIGFVDLAVAIVVFAIADLAAWEAFILARAPLTVLARLNTCLADTAITAVLGPVVTSAAITELAATQPRRVDHTVAVVVFAVAAFFSRLIVAVVLVVSA